MGVSAHPEPNQALRGPCADLQIQAVCTQLAAPMPWGKAVPQTPQVGWVQHLQGRCSTLDCGPHPRAHTASS